MYIPKTYPRVAPRIKKPNKKDVLRICKDDWTWASTLKGILITTQAKLLRNTDEAEPSKSKYLNLLTYT